VLRPKPRRIPDAGKSASLRPALPEAAAWLHDIGYAPGLAVTGLHALDGARLEFKPAPYALASVLTYCDMSTSQCREQQGFEAMRDNGELAARADPAELALTVISALQGGLLMAQATRSARPLELTLNMAVQYMAGYRRRPKQAGRR
jgi:hypothetical protein